MYKPMLAPPDSPLKNPNYFDQLKLPLLASPKLDGIRCVTKSRRATVATSDFEMSEVGPYQDLCLSRKLLPLPSRQVQTLFSPFQELDGELLVGNETDHDVYNRTQSYVMSDDKPAGNIAYRVFDTADEDFADAPFQERLNVARDLIAYYQQKYPATNVSIVEHQLCKSIADVLVYEDWALSEGYEGVMLRNPQGYYKYNRGTFREGLIYKLKREQDDEFQIVGFIEEQTNTNEKTTDDTGHAKRSSAMAGLVPAGTLGKFVVEYKGREIPVACGSATHAQRQEIWDSRANYRFKTIVVRHFPHGAKDILRFPRFIGFRNLEHM